MELECLNLKSNIENIIKGTQAAPSSHRKYLGSTMETTKGDEIVSQYFEDMELQNIEMQQVHIEPGEAYF